MIAALAEGVIDVIVSDHNPQDVETKRQPFAEAENGALGLETMLSAGLRLVQTGQLTLSRLLAALSHNPASLIGQPGGALAAGKPADLILLDIDYPYIVDKMKLHSKSKNSPFDEARLTGKVLKTYIAGRLIYEYDEQ